MQLVVLVVVVVVVVVVMPTTTSDARPHVSLPHETPRCRSITSTTSTSSISTSRCPFTSFFTYVFRFSRVQEWRKVGDDPRGDNRWLHATSLASCWRRW